MKKIYILLAFLLTGVSFAKAQDTLLFEDFELNNFYTNILINSGTPPSGLAVDTNWYSWDSDATPDGSTAGTRPDGWFAVQPFSTVDQYITPYLPGPDTNTVIAANTWTNTSTPESNWLITKNIQLGLHDTLFWKSATFQTPRYCDGYQVLLSTTTNADNTVTAFSTVLFNAKEMTVLGSDSTYSTFTFANTGTGGPAGFVHGMDGLYTDPASTTAPISHRGRLRPFSKPLDAFANMNVFIAFLSNGTDDNLISLDDVMIRGSLPPGAGVNENKNDLSLAVFPNPASDNVQINYTLTAETVVSINVYDVAGKLVATQSNGSQAQGLHFAHINTAELAKGFYTVNVKTGNASSTSKLLIVR
jgi:hypothetical protein